MLKLTDPNWLRQTFPNTKQGTLTVIVVKYNVLTEEQRAIAHAGIERHFRCCDKLDIPYDAQATYEIITDARKGRAMWIEA